MDHPHKIRPLILDARIIGHLFRCTEECCRVALFDKLNVQRYMRPIAQEVRYLKAHKLVLLIDVGFFASLRKCAKIVRSNRHRGIVSIQRPFKQIATLLHIRKRIKIDPMQSPIRKKIIVVTVLFAMLVLGGTGGFYFGFRAGEQFPKTLLIQGAANLDSAKPGTVDFSTFWQEWATITEHYLRDKDVSAQTKIYGAMKGLVASLNDPYSEFFTPPEATKFQDDVRGNFGGIGAELGIRENQLLIIAPLPETPASRAGIVAGDKIVMINGSSTDGISVDAAVKLIRGEVKTKVTLTIFRDGWDKPKEFPIVRDVIIVPTVDFAMNGNIAVIKLHQFNENAVGLFYNAAQNALDDGARGMVLDLRNDPGGYLQVAVDIAGLFLTKNTLVVSEASRSGSPQELRSTGSGALKKFPLVVLLNKGSASASEILAGTLRDNLGTKLVGEQSYGKGTVQQVLPLRDGSTVKITIAHWVLPKGTILEDGGLKPDYEVKLTEDDIKNKKDPQLDKALEILKTQYAL